MFEAMDLPPVPTDEQMKVMAALKHGNYLERGDKVFQAWYHVQAEPLVGCWMLIFYECFGFLVFHTSQPGSHPLWRDAVS